MKNSNGHELVKFRNVTKTFKNGETIILKNFNFDFLEGETHVICGKSGSGKSTLIRCINYLEKIDQGQIFFEETEVGQLSAKGIRKKIAMVFQEFNLFPHMTVLENVIFGPINALHINKKETIESGKEYLDKVGLIEKINVHPVELSGGQKQRVAIARALNMHPDLILFDEPTSALDPEMVGEVINIMEQLSSEGRSMIVVTHEMKFAREAANRISFLDNGQFVETSDPNDFFNSPKHASVAKFIEQLQYDKKKR
jgi:ABC-type polar amino acid transport system ATPase subunit